MFCGMFSQVPTVARGKYMTNHTKEEQFLYDWSRKDQDRDRVHNCQWGTLNLQGILTW